MIDRMTRRIFAAVSRREGIRFDLDDGEWIEARNLGNRVALRSSMPMQVTVRWKNADVRTDES